MWSAIGVIHNKELQYLMVDYTLFVRNEYWSWYETTKFKNSNCSVSASKIHVLRCGRDVVWHVSTVSPQTPCCLHCTGPHPRSCQPASPGGRPSPSLTGSAVWNTSWRWRWGRRKRGCVLTFIHCILPDFVFEAGSQEIKPEAIP